MNNIFNKHPTKHVHSSYTHPSYSLSLSHFLPRYSHHRTTDRHCRIHHRLGTSARSRNLLTTRLHQQRQLCMFTLTILTLSSSSSQVVINSTVNIVDSPRFHHRGIMLDSSRHFLPVPIIKKNLVGDEYGIALNNRDRIGCDGIQQAERVSLAPG